MAWLIAYEETFNSTGTVVRENDVIDMHPSDWLLNARKEDREHGSIKTVLLFALQLDGRSRTISKLREAL